jgi:hypothetical protein
MDDDWDYIVNEFNMNYTTEFIRQGYLEQKEKETSVPDDDLLKKLGYSDNDLLKRK